MFVSRPVSRLSAATTEKPSPNNRSHRWDPTKPAPPVTRARLLFIFLVVAMQALSRGRAFRQGRSPTHAVVAQSVRRHGFRIVEIASVNHDGITQPASNL